MRFWLPLAALALEATLALAPAQEPQQEPAPGKEPPPDPAMLALREKLNPEYPSWSPAEVFERAAEFLASYRDGIEKAIASGGRDPQSPASQERVCQELKYIRFFDMAETPRAFLPSGTASLMFGVNQAALIPVSVMVRAVPSTDNRLYWFDLRWFNWTPEAWEKLAEEDPYFREPIIPSDAPGLNYVRRETHANAILRADWFLWYVYDNGEFINAQNAEIFNPKAFYYTLVYANAAFDRLQEKEVEEEVEEEYVQKVRKQVPQRDQYGGTYYVDKIVPVKKTRTVTKTVKKKVKVRIKGEAPRTAAEFESAWGVDFDDLKKFPIDRGAYLDRGASSVAWENRVVWRVRSKRGVYWRTFDTFRTTGDQDFLENPFPKKFDAGEHIFQDDRGAQFYLLSNGKGQAVDFANPFVVKGDPAGPHNTVLVTARSCIHCHDVGILNFKNRHEELSRLGLEQKAYDPARDERFHQFFMQQKKMERLVRQDQDNYKDFVADVNGLTPEENVQSFQRYRQWYGKNVDLVQACRELGVREPSELQDALGYQATKGRLGLLALNGTPIPRSVWERGGYAEAGLLLREWRKKARMHGGDGRKPSRKSSKGVGE